MVFKNFRINVIIRILLILGGLILIAVWITEHHYLRGAYMGIFVIGLLVEMFLYIDRLNRNVANFFSALLHDDFSQHLAQQGKGKSFRLLFNILNALNEKMSSLGKEKESHGRYLFSLIEQVRVGLLSVDQSGQVFIVNRTLIELLGLYHIKTGSNLYESSPEVMNVINQIRPGEHQLIKWKRGESEIPFSFQISVFKIEEKEYTLLSVHDIRTELEEKEVEAWHKLIRVLTHEIMNSVTPVLSLSSSLNDLVNSKAAGIRDEKLKSRLMDGLMAIQDRSSGLLKFTEAYQDLTRLPSPRIQPIETRDLLKRIEALYANQFREQNIQFNIQYTGEPESFKGDIKLLEQVLINLIKNAREAVSQSVPPVVELIVTSPPKHQVSITVRDNGEGIPNDILDKIFVPFYSTKEDGSGIGLSVSKQIIMMHRGILEARSKPGSGSEFEILL
jgi:two-component system nitrogen regulation sensor histidine kinase NtrY